MKFSLLQLTLCIAIILFIAFFVIKTYSGIRPIKISAPDNPQITVPFQNIKIKSTVPVK